MGEKDPRKRKWVFAAYVNEYDEINEICHSTTVLENHRKVSFDIASEASYVYILN